MCDFVGHCFVFVIKENMKGSLIDWQAFHYASCDGNMMELLMKVPRTLWTERESESRSLLHYAVRGENVAALVTLIQSGLDLNACDSWHESAIHDAIRSRQHRMLEILCAAGANMCPQNDCFKSPLQLAIARYLGHDDSDESARVLIANGVRLYGHYLATPDLLHFERGVLRCRTAVVAMLRVKRAGNLWTWDKFLLKEMAICVWATRYNENWQ